MSVRICSWRYPTANLGLYLSIRIGMAKALKDDQKIRCKKQRNRILICRTFLLFFVLLCSSRTQIHAQKVVDKVVNSEQRRKLEKAKKFYNEHRIFEGEKILKELVRENPQDPYFHEALVQMQRQVLERIAATSDELKSLQPQQEMKDTSEADGSDEEVNHNDGKIIPRGTDPVKWSGLDRSDDQGSDEKPRKRRKELEEPEPTDATVTIDSSILRQPDGEEKQLSWSQKEEKMRMQALSKRLKELADLAMIPYEPYKHDFIQNCRLATLKLFGVDSASAYLRQFMVDTSDQGYSAPDEAKNFYEQGLEELAGANPSLAAPLFEKALAIYPTHYMGMLKLGDAYYVMNRDTAAIRLYKKASELNPIRPEAWEKLSMSLYQRGMYEEAAASIIEAIIAYPQQHYFTILKRIVQKTAADFNLQWIPREVYPLTTAHVWEEIIVDDKSPWWHYQAAKQDVYSYFDTLGMVRPNDKTKEKYLEMYAWKKMLNNSSRKHFQFARAMEKLGYLDCYVFITLFHKDLYGQFADFSVNNMARIKEYFFILINWEDKRFDKVRKAVAPPAESKGK